MIAAFDAMAHEFERADRGLAELSARQGSMFLSDLGAMGSTMGSDTPGR